MTTLTPFQVLSKQFKGSTCKILKETQEIQMCAHMGVAVCKCSIRVNDAPNITCDITSPLIVNSQRHIPEIAKLIELINKRCLSGSFNIDTSNGEFSYTNGVHIPNSGLCNAFVGELYRQSKHVFSYYFPAFMSVMYGGCTPDDAVFLLEVTAYDSQDHTSVVDIG